MGSIDNFEFNKIRSKILACKEIEAIGELTHLSEICFDEKVEAKIDELIRFARFLYKKKNAKTLATSKVSIIIPAFNSGLYIKRCVESALFQSYRNLEVVVVNDCSSDKTKTILEDLALTHSNLILINRSSQSGGPSIPRMEGLVAASGEFIYFLDSDDWIDSDVIVRLVESGDENLSDLVLMEGFYNHISSENIEIRKYKSEFINRAPSEFMGRYHESFFLWDKLYRKDFLIENNLTLAHTKASEEVPFIIKSYFYAKKISVSKDLIGYHYSRERDGSITSSTRKNEYPSYEFAAWDSIFNWMKSGEVDSNYCKLIDVRRCVSLSYALRIVNPIHKKRFFIEVKDNILYIDLDFCKEVFNELSWSSKYKEISIICNENFDQYLSSLVGHNELSLKSRGIAYCPDWSAANPYQKLLYNAINKKFNVQATSVSIKEVVDNPDEFSTRYQYLHLHWVHGWLNYKDRERVESVLNKLSLIKSMGVKIIWTVHNLFMHDLGGSENELIVRIKIAALSDYIFIHSDYAKKLISEIYGIDNNDPRLIILKHGHYSNYYGEFRDVNRSRKIIKIPNKGLVIGCIGEIKPYKGVVEFVEELFHQVDEQSNYTLFVAGACKDVALKERLNSIAKKNKNLILKLERVNDNDIRNYVCACDIVAIPYKKYLTSGAAILALTYKKPVVYADGSLSETVNRSRGSLGWSTGHKGKYKTPKDIINHLSSNAIDFENTLQEMPFDDYLNKESFETIVSNSLKSVFIIR